LDLIWADAGYSGQLVDWVNSTYGWILEIIKRSDDVKGFQVLPRRRVLNVLLDGWVDIDG
jgi:putative transposase